MLRIMRVFAALAAKPSWVVMDVEPVAHVVSALGSRVVSASNVFGVSSCTDRQDVGTSGVYLLKGKPQCIQPVLECGINNAQPASKAAICLNERYPTA